MPHPGVILPLSEAGSDLGRVSHDGAITRYLFCLYHSIDTHNKHSAYPSITLEDASQHRIARGTEKRTRNLEVNATTITLCRSTMMSMGGLLSLCNVNR